MKETVTAFTAHSLATCKQHTVNSERHDMSDSELWEHRSSREMRKGEEGETDSEDNKYMSQSLSNSDPLLGLPPSKAVSFNLCAFSSKTVSLNKILLGSPVTKTNRSS